MKPIVFEHRRFFGRTAGQIAAEIADMSRWPAFDGYGPLPGIASAAYEGSPGPTAGARIRVQNRDGSSHVETMEVWEPPERIVLRLHEFGPPLSRLASHFLEEWRLTAAEGGTEVARQFQFYPRWPLARPAVWLIARLMSRAIDRHMDRIAAGDG